MLIAWCCINNIIFFFFYCLFICRPKNLKLMPRHLFYLFYIFFLSQQNKWDFLMIRGYFKFFGTLKLEKDMPTTRLNSCHMEHGVLSRDKQSGRPESARTNLLLKTHTKYIHFFLLPLFSRSWQKKKTKIQIKSRKLKIK